MNSDTPLRTLFNGALDRSDPAERARYLDEACRGDASLRERVEQLLRAHEDAGGFLAQPSKPSSSPPPAATLPRPVTEKAGDTIGRYKLLQQIGEGGCGVVYMAEQEEPVRRRVALKVIKLGMDTKQVVARFEAERQALALMDHPNIAKVFDAGATEAPVAAGILPAVEPGFQPGGRGEDDSKRAEISVASPGGKMPPSTAGETPAATLSAGRPYFVMELVRGTKITQFCDEKKLSPRERLELFIPVCQAIQHAHQKGIIHRDLKPSNILVTMIDGNAVPKVIDFGIAKATNNQRLTDMTVFTAFEQFIGTPAYMSPEQAEMSGVDIDTRTDIYSLGVVLYELLTGGPPFDQKMLLAAGLDEMRRTIREVEPVKPSTRLTQQLVAAPRQSAADSATENGGALPRRRYGQIQELIHVVRGDLDWIVMKCLEKDRARRYETANGLARDIQRHLDCEPVFARPPSRLYEFQKTVRRHKFGFASAVALIIVLAGGALVSTWQAVRATKAEREQSRLRERAEANEKKAETEAAKSRQVATFLQDMLRGVSPSVALGRDTTMLREILDKTVERLAKDLTNQPEVEAELRDTIGEVYYLAGAYEKAEAIHREALAIRNQLFGRESLQVAASLHHLGCVIADMDKPAEAESLLREALATRRKLLGSEHPDVATAMYNLPHALRKQGKMIEAETLARDALVMRRKLLGNEHPDTAKTLSNLADTLRLSGRPAEAEPLQREAVAIRRKLFGNEHPDLALSLSGLGMALLDQGKLDEAESPLREALAIRKKLLGDHHPRVAGSLENLILALRAQGKLAEAETALRELLALRRKTLDSENPNIAAGLDALASVLRAQGKAAELEAIYSEIVAIYRADLAKKKQRFGDVHREVDNALVNLARTLGQIGKLAEAEAVWREEVAVEKKLSGEQHPFVANSLFELASALEAQGKPAEAEAAYRECLGIREKANPKEWLTFFSRSLLGDTLLAQKKYAEAEPLLLSGYEGMKLREASIPDQVRLARLKEAVARIVRLYEQTGRDDEVARWQKPLADYVKAETASREVTNAGRLAMLASRLLAEQKYVEAESSARECLSLREQAIPDQWLTFNARSMLGGSLLGQKKFAEAEPLLLAAYEGLEQRQEKIPVDFRFMRLKEAVQHLVQLYEATDRPDQAAEWKARLAELDKAETAQREAVSLWASGNAHACAGRWQEAAADLSRLIELRPAEHLTYHHLTAVLVQKGDREAYRRHCARIVERFATTTDPSTAERMAKDCLILPASGVDLGLIGKLADTAVAAGEAHNDLPWFQFAKGLAEYRLGRFTNAVDWLKKTLRSRGALDRDAPAHLVLAMAEHQLRHSEAAQAALRKGTEMVETSLPKLEPGAIPGNWVDLVFAHALRREAEELIERK